MRYGCVVFISVYFKESWNINMYRHCFRRSVDVYSHFFKVLPVFTAIGVQLYVNMNIKRSSKFLSVSEAEAEDKLYISFITPWDMIIIGVGGFFAFVVGILVFLTTIHKSSKNPKIRFRKISRNSDEIRIVENEEEGTDEEEEF